MLVFIANLISGVSIISIILIGVHESFVMILTSIFFIFTGLIIQLSIFKICRKIDSSEIIVNERITAIKRKVINLNRRSNSIIHDVNQ